jgi:hypothetical protein
MPPPPSISPCALTLTPYARHRLPIKPPGRPLLPPFRLSARDTPRMTEFVARVPPICRHFWPNLAPPVSPSPPSSPSRLPLLWCISQTCSSFFLRSRSMCPSSAGSCRPHLQLWRAIVVPPDHFNPSDFATVLASMLAIYR